MKRLNITTVACTLLAASFTFAEPSPNFEKDRKAILGMVGEFSVKFHFHETLSLNSSYQIKDKPYNEEAFEIVKLAEDSGRKIVLQHILQVDGIVVKHWAHTWTYEDQELLQFQGHRTWEKQMISENEAEGAWTQRVTEVTDEPRYEGYGRWTHHGGISEWSSHLSNRPLPRREYTKRSDYDLLVVVNRHTVTTNGWYHEQDNTKWVKRDGKNYPLAREVGMNRYERVKGEDFAKAENYWKNTSNFWAKVREIWDSSIAPATKIELKEKVNEESFHDVIGKLTKRSSKGESVSKEEIQAVVAPFVVVTPK
ncbi:MAG: hypothetical protein HC845_15805 [Akkermansiaceae bacterium]|nr:hypothetical protein [Akkermansiaceae bacterium]